MQIRLLSLSIKKQSSILKPPFLPPKFNCFKRKCRKKVLDDWMPPKTLGGNSSVERVIKCKDGRTQIHVIKGGGGACRKVHSMQRNKTVPNNAFWARTKINHTNKQKIKKIKTNKARPFPKEFSLLCFFSFSFFKPNLNSSLNAAGPKYQNFSKVHASALKFRGKEHELCRVEGSG